MEQQTAQAADGRLEARTRFAADRGAIIATLLGAADPGPVTAITPGLPGRPQEGHSASRLSFADGRAVIYRPRGVAAEQWFSGLLDWLNEQVPQAGLRAAAALPRYGYGWVELVHHQPAAEPAGVSRLYRRCGLLLALLYALDVAGLPGGSVVASGDCPVLVDLEAVLASRRTTPDGPPEPAAAMLAASVHRTGLLQLIGAPGWLTASPGAAGLAAEQTAAAGRADSHGPGDPVSRETAVLAGFRLGYGALMTRRDEFTRLLRDARDLDGHQPGLDRAAGKIARLSEVDRRDQEWIISAELAAGQPPAGYPGVVAGPLTTIAAEPARLLAAACGLADQIVSQGVTGSPGASAGRVNWLSFQAGEDGGWAVRPMRAGLGSGYLGVALYLAQLADLTGIARYAEVARQALTAVPPLLESLGSRPELLAAIGCGAHSGLGGISYGLARMATLLRDPQLSDWAITAAGLAAAAVAPATRPGWADGAAGCLAAMTAVFSETGSREASGLARAIAGQLVGLIDETDGGCGPGATGPAAGFAYGPAGVGWAVARFAAGNEPGWLPAGRRAVERAVGLAPLAPRDAGDGWCRGTAGILLASSCLADERSLARLRAGVLALAQRPVPRDLSLCHGELGIAEALSVLSLTSRAGAPPRLLRRRAGLVLDALARHDRYCGTPGGVSTPELLTGLAGIGYGLLRVGFLARVPAVLSLEPTPAHHRPR